MGHYRRIWGLSGLVLVCLAGSIPAWAEPQADVDGDPPNYLAQMVKQDERIENEIEPVGADAWKKPIPLTVGVEYTLVSDYIFRGINFSEYRRKWGQSDNERVEDPNHQLYVPLELDLGQVGRVGGSFWFEWFAGQEKLTPQSSGELQEVDYNVYYAYLIEPIGLDVTVGFMWYHFPRLTGDGRTTQEIQANLAWDDSILWRALGCDVDEAVLNPYLFFAHDLDLAPSGHYWEFGLSHEFPFRELGMEGVPVAENFSITPSWAMAWHHNWLNKFTVDYRFQDGWKSRSNTSGLVNMVWGLDMTYDLKEQFDVPDRYCGAMYVNGFLRYSQDLADAYIRDEIWGGVSVGYEW